LKRGIALKRLCKKSLSVLLAVMLVLGAAPLFVFAETDDLITHQIDIYANGAPVTQQIVLKEGDTLQLTAMLIDCSMPSGGYFYWESETPILASVDQNGLLRAHDSSKGAILRLWIDNEIRPIPVVGDATATAIYALFDGMDIDAMDAEGILNVVETGASVLPGSLTTTLIDKLRTMLNTMDTGITAILYDGSGVERARDQVRVLVNKSTAITADFFPNGTTITNKAQVPKTVEVGYTFQLQAVTTPMRLHMGVNYTIKSGKDYATLSDTGLATFTAPGEVTLMASPDVKGFMDNVLKYAALVGNDPEAIAGTVASVLVKLGLPISENIVKYALWGLLYLVGTENAVAWSEGAITTVANYLLKLSTNDTVTVTVVSDLQVTSFSIAGNTTVNEGESQQLAAANIVPKGATTNGITWSVANTDYAKVSGTGLLFGRDALSATGTKTTSVTAVLDGVTVTVPVTVKGKAVTAVQEVAITGPSTALVGSLTQMIVKTYPSRILATVTWGLLADDGKTELFATATASAQNSAASVNKNGILIPLNGGTVTVIAKTSDTVKTYYKVFVGILVTGVSITEAPNVAVKVPLTQSYKNASASLHAVVTPADATNKTILWSSSTTDIAVGSDGVCSPTKNSKCWAVITATTQDGGYQATCVVSFANYPVKSVSLDKSNMALYIGATGTLNESIQADATPGIGASIQDVFWTSSNPAVASVNNDGVVTAIKVGNAVITVTTIDGFKTASCAVTVRANKTALNNLIALIENENLNPGDYDPADFDAFLGALAEAYAVQSNELASQQEVDAATSYLAVNFNALNAYTPIQSVQIRYNNAAAPDYVTYKVGTLENYANQSMQFSYALTPADADYKSVTWSSSNSAMSVDQTGKCSPNTNNPTWSVITVTAEDYLGHTYTDKVNVAFARVLVTGISLNITSVPNALIHNTTQLTATITPTGTLGIGAASVQDVEWTSDNPTVATVNGSGLVTYVGRGAATITARTRDGGFAATCAVTVSLNKTALQTALNTVNNANLDYTRYTPDTWAVLAAALMRAQQAYDDPNVEQAEIDQATAELNAAYAALKTYIYVNSVTIYKGDSPAPDYVAAEVGDLANYTNQTIELSLRMSPLDSFYQSIIWSSSSSTVSVDSNGVCRPTQNNACWAVITVTVTTYYGRTVSDSVTVSFAKKPATSVVLNPTSINASIGNAPQQIACSVKNTGLLGTSDANIQNVVWSSDNPNAIPVTQSGVVSFLDSGSANIRATSVNGGVYAVCTVVVSGNKTALGEAIAYIDAQHVNVQDYEYTTSTAFSQAYAHAVEVYNGNTFTQQEIDAATAALYATFSALQPYIHMTDLTILYNGSPAPSHISRKVELWQIYSNQSIQLSYSFAPANSMYTSIVWASNDSSLSVDQTGKCKPSANKAAGALVTLTATDHYGNKFVDSVFVAFANYQVTGMTIDKTSLTAIVGDAPVTITSSFTPTGTFDASVKKTYWTSSNPAVASVNQSGVVTYVDAGQCTITATSYDGDFSKTCAVTVRANKTALNNAIASMLGFNLDPEMYTPDSWAAFAAALAAAQAVSAEEFASQTAVNNARTSLLAAFDALVAFVALNQVGITYNGTLSSGFVSVDVPLTSTYQNKSAQLGYALFPVDATITSVTWSSSSGSISVTNEGLCRPTANNACWAVITVTVKDYKNNIRTASTYVSFANYPVTGVTVSPSSISNAIVGGSATLSKSVTPAGTLGVGAANIQDVLWSSADSSIASVTQGGVVSFNNVGTVLITATTIDGGYTSSCTVTVSANKQTLAAAIASLANYPQANYTPASWAAMMTVYNAAVAVNTNPLSTQAQVDTATTNLINAYAALAPYIYVTSAAISVGGVNQNGFVINRVPVGTAFTAASVTLGVIINPANAMYQTISWSSSSAKISVTQSGVAKPTLNESCYATITCTVTDHFGKTYKATAVVAFVRVGTASLTLSPEVVNANINGGTVQLTAVQTGDNGGTPDFPVLQWSSNNPAVASVTQTGLVTIGIGGRAVITVTTQLGELKAQCVVNVSIDKTQLAAICNAVIYANYQAKDYTAASYAALKAALEHGIAVYADKNADQTQVDAATAALTQARNNLVPRTPLTGVDILYNSASAPAFISYKVPLTSTYNSCSVQLGAAFLPAAGEYQSAVWASSSSSITVDQTGKCSPSENKAGAALITFTATDSTGKTFTDSVWVAFANIQATGVTLDKTTLSFAIGGASQKITPEIAPKGVLGVGAASVQGVHWTTSNASVAVVDASGNVSPVGVGSATITCYTDDGGKTATCAVTVTGPIVTAASGTTTVINNAKKIIYGIPEGSTNLNSLISSTGGTLVFTPTPNGYGTGTIVELKVNGVTIAAYTVIIFGDGNGDGRVDAGDAVMAILSENYRLELNATQAYALDVNGDGNVDSNDAGRILDAGLFIDTIDQAHPY